MANDHLYRFTRNQRVIKADEFSSAFRLKPAGKTAHFMLYLKTNLLAFARLGVVIPKRLAPRAVTRNTLKRTIREHFRLGRFPRADYIVRLSRPINTKTEPATSTHLKNLLHTELAQLLSNTQKTSE